MRSRTGTLRWTRRVATGASASRAQKETPTNSRAGCSATSTVRTPEAHARARVQSSTTASVCASTRTMSCVATRDRASVASRCGTVAPTLVRRTITGRGPTGRTSLTTTLPFAAVVPPACCCCCCSCCCGGGTVVVEGRSEGSGGGGMWVLSAVATGLTGTGAGAGAGESESEGGVMLRW